MTDYTIWDGDYPGTQLAVANAGEVIRLGNAFALTSPLSGWSCTGGRLWIDPSNIGELEATFAAYAYLVTDLTTPVATEAAVSIGTGGWAPWVWDTAFDMPEDQTEVLIAYQFGTTQRFLSSGLGSPGATLAADTINLELLPAASPRSYYALSGGAFNENFDGPMYGVDIIVTDGGAALEPIPITATRLTNSSVLIEWTQPDDAPDGVSVYRAPGAHTTDGNDIPFGAPGYDPLTIPDIVAIEEGLTASPLNDDGLDAGQIYTYAIIRTGDGA